MVGFNRKISACVTVAERNELIARFWPYHTPHHIIA